MLKWVPRARILLPAGILFGAVVGAVYAHFAKPVYESVASVVLYRDRVENPNSVSEDAKNRWVWVRDGLTLTESLLSDDFLEHFIGETPTLTARYDRFRGCQLRCHPGAAPEATLSRYVQEIRKEVHIDYTGGDSNTFVFQVQDSSPTVARDLAAAMVDQLRNYWVTELDHLYADSLGAIAQEIPRAEAPGSAIKSRPYLVNVYNGLLVASRLSAVASQRGFQVVRKPALPVGRRWPKTGWLVGLGALAGLLVAGFFAHLKRSVEEAG